MKLLGTSSFKTSKGESKGFLTGILYLKPSDSGGRGNLCAFASAGCRAACLNTAGRGAMNAVQAGRQRKTDLWFDDKELFMSQICSDIEALERKAQREGMTPVIRLNGTSDIPWENVEVDGFKNIMEKYPHIQFYDYTKNPNRVNLPANYHITFSLAEDNDENARQALKNGVNVAAVFFNQPETFFGRTVINGDETDLRFMDESGVIVGLTAKGKAKKDTTGFVR